MARYKFYLLTYLLTSFGSSTMITCAKNVILLQYVIDKVIKTINNVVDNLVNSLRRRQVKQLQITLKNT
jgi:hypothetical protein